MVERFSQKLNTTSYVRMTLMTCLCANCETTYCVLCRPLVPNKRILPNICRNEKKKHFVLNQNILVFLFHIKLNVQTRAVQNSS